MEVYKGQPIKKWDCGLGKESQQQKKKIEKLRRKYATKILLHDLNLLKDNFLKEAENFAKIPLDEQEKILADALLRKNERVAG